VFAKKRERNRTHLLGQGIKLREGFDGVWFVRELLEERRVLDRIDEFVVGLLCRPPRRG